MGSLMRICAAVVALCAASPPAAGASVYECVVNGARVFSDQPCAANAAQRQIGESNRMTAPVQSTHAESHSPALTQRHVNRDSDITQLKADCNRLRQQQQAVRGQERSGYTLKQGERLRESRIKLDGQYQQMRCERYR